MEAEFSGLLRELAACGHQAPTLLDRARLPGWCRRPLFFFLGYIAKAEGRVTEADIGYAEGVIKALKLSQRQRKRAINWFQEGKSVNELPRVRGLSFRLSNRLWPAPAITVAICLCHGSQLKGQPGKSRRYRCEDAIDQMGLPVSVSDDIFESYASKVWRRQADNLPQPTSYEQACQLLGVTRRETLTDIKRAYRRKVSECHPDKLAQQHMDAIEQRAAKDRLLRYQQAWELIKRRHKAAR
ncbi:MAG: molecular chaperone DjlA [Gammaproteobacteria bacterium]|uniref:DnaJ-like protein DjlA n=2 Tax=Marinobacter nitratireducens TaxID=1137280 RepID=A0A072N1G2_9GAMM|nr:DnaJ domain-containing protein [Marinobacter nitratireducens]KEF30778.1 DnaJ-like protein DjlA [Marinobacter nitratireducens]TNE78789.1 MAG: molecular chaperone DjlA [Gammaproteobacteria bacterium]